MGAVICIPFWGTCMASKKASKSGVQITIPFFIYFYTYKYLLTFKKY